MTHGAATRVLPLKPARRKFPDSTSENVLVIGGGMAGFRLCEKISESPAFSRFTLTMVGEEDIPAYDRVHLTDALKGKHSDQLLLAPKAWYAERGMELILGDAVVSLEPEPGMAVTRSGRRIAFDRAVLATGSRPFIPPIPGADLPGVFVYRTLKDLEAISAFGRAGAHALVLGGGLLGLEAARALRDLGLWITLIENAPCLLPRQLNPQAGDLVRREIESMGIRVLTSTGLAALDQTENGLRASTQDGLTLEASMVVLAAGVRPRDELAKACGLEIGARGGVVVDDFLRTSHPKIFAIGECAVHRGVNYGLAAPGYRMAEAMIRQWTESPKPFRGADQSTTLKVLGVTVHVIGEHTAAEPSLNFASDTLYRHLILKRNKIVGAIGVSNWSEADRIRLAALAGKRVWPWQQRRFVKTGMLWPAAAPMPQTWPDTALVCHCRQIDKGAVCAAIAQGCVTLDALRAKTGATSVCGGCTPVVQQLLGAPSAPTTGSGLAWVSWLTLIFAALLCVAPPLPVSPSAQTRWHQIEILWRNSFWHQFTGYTLLGLMTLGMLLPLRKRIAWFQLKSVATWRWVHGLLGLITVMGLSLHTGWRLGSGVNRALAVTFLIACVLGAAAGLAFDWADRRATPANAQIRRGIAYGHLVLTWPLPILLVFHIWSVYFF